MDSFYDCRSSSDYAEINSIDCSPYEIDRNRVDLGNILGAGQFGDVFRGTYLDQTDVLRSVAIKTCKLEGEEEMAEKLLTEADILGQFDHEHIIRLFGVCSSTPVWIVMELAEYGEIRYFLKDNKDNLPADQLVMYCHQLSTAMVYLESKHFVHRDIAARNVLVSSWQCAKLADFGLSRWLEENNYYKASKSFKLPIKWMAPESINYRRFTTSSDVWMFAVCLWEILMFGEKPFQGIENNKVAQLLEENVRLTMPVTCPPRLFLIMCSCWNYESDDRPKFSEIESRIRGILLDERQLQEAEENLKLKLKRQHFKDSSTELELTPPQKPSRLMNRRISGAVALSTPDLNDEQINYQLTNEPNRQMQPHGWRSVNTLVDISSSSSSSSNLHHHHHHHESKDDSHLTISDDDFFHLKKPPNEEYNRQMFQNYCDSLEKKIFQQQIDENWMKVVETNNKQMQNYSGWNEAKVREREEKERERERILAEEKIIKEIILNRNDDNVYSSTICLIKSITSMIQNVDQTDQPVMKQHYLDMVMKIGLNLRNLLTSVNEAYTNFSIETQNQVTMATKVLNSDMASLVHSMKLAQQYSNTVLDKEYEKTMLQASHVLAVDSRNLLDAVDFARQKQIYTRRLQEEH